MAKSVGTLIKEARIGAGLTQEALARKIAGVSPSDISRAERGEIKFTQAILKKIAKACGVTQASLLEAAKGSSKKTTAKKTAAKKTTAKKSTASTSSMKVTAAEKRLVELYRKATAEDKKEAVRALKGEDDPDLLESLGDLLGKIL